MTTLTGKTVIVTGCNSGIGKETAKTLAIKGARVIMACRSENKAELARQEIIKETGNDDVIFMKLDLSSFASIRAFAQVFNEQESRLDILVNNAGVLTSERMLTHDGNEMVFGTNHLGHFLLTNLLLEKLKASAPSRVVIVASIAHEPNPIVLEDLNSEHNFSSGADVVTYGRSKTANVLFGVHLAKLLEVPHATRHDKPYVYREDRKGWGFLMTSALLTGAHGTTTGPDATLGCRPRVALELPPSTGHPNRTGTGVTVYSLHPGVIMTELARDMPCHGSCWLACGLWLIVRCCLCMPIVSAEDGAKTSLYCCCEPSIAQHTGRYYSECREKEAKPHATNPETAKRLWELSVDMCGL